jgi:hypothetical protein
MRKQRGSIPLEFALVGIPLIFTMISIEEMSRGMWIYFSQAYAVNEGVRYVTVRGADCTSNGNSCGATVGQIATQISNFGIGLVPGFWNVTLQSASSSNIVNCNPLSSCFTNNTAWPPPPDNAVGSTISITGSYPFTSALSMFFPGGRAVSFGTYNLPAYSYQLIVY